LGIDDTVMDELLSVDAESWRAELAQIEEHYASLGATVPAALRDELEELEKRLAQ
jgi:phosphoenolpyruvate carboxykinase (GTP)